MAKSNVDVSIDTAAIDRRFFENDKLNKQIAQIILDESEDYTPYRTGATTKSGMAYTGYIEYGTEYAPKIYETPMAFRKIFHSRATDHWVHVAYDENIDEITDRIQDEINRR